MKLILAIFACLLISACTCQCPEMTRLEWQVPESPILENVEFRETTEIDGHSIFAVSQADKEKIEQNQKRLKLHINLLEQAMKFMGEVN